MGRPQKMDRRYYDSRMPKRKELVLLFFVASLALFFVEAHRYYAVAYASRAQAASSTLHGDPAHPGQTAGWVDTRLYFGLGPADESNKGTTEAAWREFLDKEVTPRFPGGLSVLEVYGQWQGTGQVAPGRERSKLLVIDYPATAENAAKIEAIRVAWKQRTHAQSVLKVTQPADVSF
jgi:hypothetical protein